MCVNNLPRVALDSGEAGIRSLQCYHVNVRLAKITHSQLTRYTSAMTVALM